MLNQRKQPEKVTHTETSQLSHLRSRTVTVLKAARKSVVLWLATCLVVTKPKPSSQWCLTYAAYIAQLQPHETSNSHFRKRINAHLLKMSS